MGKKVWNELTDGQYYNGGYIHNGNQGGRPEMLQRESWTDREFAAMSGRAYNPMGAEGFPGEVIHSMRRSDNPEEYDRVLAKLRKGR